jgi:integrase
MNEQENRNDLSGSVRGERGPIRTIQYMLGHKSLETTQKYLGITNLDSLTDKIDAASVIV